MWWKEIKCRLHCLNEKIYFVGLISHRMSLDIRVYPRTSCSCQTPVFNSIQFNNCSPNTSLTNSLQPIPSSPNCRGSTPTSANISSISSPLNSSSKLSSAAWNSLIVRKCFFRWSFARYLNVSCVSKRMIDWVFFFFF